MLKKTRDELEQLLTQQIAHSLLVLAIVDALIERYGEE